MIKFLDRGLHVSPVVQLHLRKCVPSHLVLLSLCIRRQCWTDSVQVYDNFGVDTFPGLLYTSVQICATGF